MSRLAASLLIGVVAGASLVANQVVDRPKPGARTPAPASRPAFDKERYRIPHKRFVLDNGLTLLVHEDHCGADRRRQPLVSRRLAQRDSAARPASRTSSSTSSSTAARTIPHGFREAMDDLGANNRNGTTNTDRTNFFEDVPVSALERTLYLEADRMGFLAKQISKEMLERERGVVQNEKRQGENQPYGRVFSADRRDDLSRRRIPTAGRRSAAWRTSNAASLDDVKEWYRDLLRPEQLRALAGRRHHRRSGRSSW